MLPPPSQILVNLYPNAFQKTVFSAAINMYTANLQYIKPNFQECNPHKAKQAIHIFSLFDVNLNCHTNIMFVNADLQKKDHVSGI
jgi:hypothetical protein